MDNLQPLSGSMEGPEQRPMKGQAVVRCEGFRCLAYQDKDGVWRSVADNKELQVLEVVIEF